MPRSFDADDLAQGWAKYGSLKELPRVESHRRAHYEDPPPLPDWRIACFYVDMWHPGRASPGPPRRGAHQIAQAGGGRMFD
jgi:hypothetical protein